MSMTTVEATGWWTYMCVLMLILLCSRLIGRRTRKE